MVMKKAMILITGLLIWTGAALGQASLKQAFESENGSAFSNLFDSKVDMYVMGKEQRLSKGDAVKTMDNFFASNHVNSFKLVHSGESRGQGSNYEIHQLQTDKRTYRVYVYYNSEGGKKLINELRIEDN